MTTITPLDERHCWHQVTPRLGAISRALRTKQALVAVYCGFECLDSACNFAEWVAVNWGKNPQFDLTIRPGKRLGTAFEVKIRKPSHEQFTALLCKAKGTPNNVIPIRRAG